MRSIVFSVLALAIIGLTTSWAVQFGDEPKYDVEILFTAAPQTPPPNHDRVPMKFNNHAAKFDCFIPRLEEDELRPVAASQPGASKSWTERSELIDMILASFYNSCFYRVTGWWIYEFCFDKHVRQFHQETQDNTVKVTAEFYLGLASSLYGYPNVVATRGQDTAAKVASDDMEEFVAPPSSRHGYTLHRPRATSSSSSSSSSSGGDKTEPYISFVWGNGTKCDLSGTPRQVEIRMFCPRPDTPVYNTLTTLQPPQTSMIAAIEESRTCKYRLDFYTDRLCRHPDFIQEKEPVHKIKCYSAPTSFTSSKQSTRADDLSLLEFHSVKGIPPSEKTDVSDEVVPSGEDGNRGDGGDIAAAADGDDGQGLCELPPEENV